MTDERSRKRPRSGRARKRLVRAYAAQAGVAYSVAARQVAAAGLHAGEALGGFGRTVYPVAVSGRGRWSLGARAARPADERVGDARRAARLPGGRAGHLVRRFPPARAGHGPLYAGEGRTALLAMLYLVAADVPPRPVSAPGRPRQRGDRGRPGVCRARPDRPPTPRRRLDDPLGSHRRCADGDRTAPAARGLPGLPRRGRRPWTGVRQVLDALLVVADDGHAPGTRVRAGAGHRRLRTRGCPGRRSGRRSATTSGSTAPPGRGGCGPTTSSCWLGRRLPTTPDRPRAAGTPGRGVADGVDLRVDLGVRATASSSSSRGVTCLFRTSSARPTAS